MMTLNEKCDSFWRQNVFVMRDCQHEGDEVKNSWTGIRLKNSCTKKLMFEGVTAVLPQC